MRYMYNKSVSYIANRHLIMTAECFFLFQIGHIVELRVLYMPISCSFKLRLTLDKTKEIVQTWKVSSVY